MLDLRAALSPPGGERALCMIEIKKVKQCLAQSHLPAQTELCPFIFETVKGCHLFTAGKVGCLGFLCTARQSQLVSENKLTPRGKSVCCNIIPQFQRAFVKNPPLKKALIHSPMLFLIHLALSADRGLGLHLRCTAQ